MKRTFLTALLCTCLYNINTYAQTDPISDSILIKKCAFAYIDWHPAQKKPAPTPLCRYAEVKDFRADTARIGIIAQYGDDRQIQAPAPVSTLMQQFINDNYTDKSTEDSLVFVIRKCWIYDSLQAGDDTTTQIIDGKAKFRQFFAFRMDLFLRAPGGLLPVSFLDTMIDASHSTLARASDRMTTFIAALIEKTGSIDRETLLQKRKIIPAHDWSAFYHARITYPIHTTSPLRKGVYASVDEFLNNTPSIPNYEIKENKKGYNDLYIPNEKGEFSYTRTAWGYSDGRQCFAMMDGELFPILRIQNAFYIWGSKAYRRDKPASSKPGISVGVLHSSAPPATTPYVSAYSPANAVSQAFIPTRKIIRKMKVFRLDPSTGEIN
jgi:hypothetical protein